MRILTFSLLVMTLISCGADNQTNTNQTITDVGSQQNDSTSVPDIGTACEAVQTGQVAAIMGWDPSKTTTNELLNRKDGRLTVCHYLEEGGTMQIMVRISHESEKSQANKVLETQYSRVLKQGHDTLKYEKIPTVLGTETLWGVGDGLHNYKSYILKSRVGNEIDINVEVSTDQSDAVTIKSQLTAILAAM